MTQSLKTHLEYLLCIKINAVRTVAGGDTSRAYLIATDSERFFCKVNSSMQALPMFRAEQKGLAVLADSKSIAIPKVLFCSTFEAEAFLIMEYIEAQQPNPLDFERLGQHLAVLHHLEQNSPFGFKTSNFIGSLPQSNTLHEDWTSFYVLERLLPQLQMAVDAQKLHPTEVPSENTLIKVCTTLFPTVKPSLLHGDLWSGNFLISAKGEPYLIDPAVYYGHHEVDLAMTALFGGFGNRFYEAYHEVVPKEDGAKERCDLYQLYYLLVHLNLFGTSYKGSVTHILTRYFG
ncbi:fructosamine kinase family protein [Croceitalea dokdonensis]|nr:fructosamine kinase family protein [Croceitalea dokdonensis]